MNYETLAAVFPVVGAITPLIVQAIKMAIDQKLVKNPNHDLIMRGITGLVAAIVGVVALVVAHNNPQTLDQWLVTVAAVAAYGIGGGAMATSVYSFVNGYLHQTSPVVTNMSPPVVNAKVSGPTTDTSNNTVVVPTNPADTPRQPY